MAASPEGRELICVVLEPEKISGFEIGSLLLGNYCLRPGENWVSKEIRKYPRYQKYIRDGVLREI